MTFWDWADKNAFVLLVVVFVVALVPIAWAEAWGERGRRRKGKPPEGE